MEVAAGVIGIAGVVGIAKELGCAILKIKEFCHDIKHAPEELLDTINSIEYFGSVLKHMGEVQTDNLRAISNNSSIEPNHVSADN